MRYQKKHDFPFGILDVADILRLNIRRRLPDQVYADCPFCSDRRGKMNLNLEKDTWRCNYCGRGGGMLGLYAVLNGVDKSQAYHDICDVLAIDGFETNYPITPKEEVPEAKGAAAVSPQELNRTLSALLSMLSLTDAHRKHLHEARGLSDDQIEQFKLRSTPPPSLCRLLTERLIRAGYTVQGVPGFYLNDYGKWTVKFYRRTSGIIIPITGADGLICGMQVRLDNPIKDENAPPEKEGTKYLTLSSSGKPMGITSGSPLHFVGDPSSRVVYVTEGCLKADIAHALTGRTFAAVIGANNVAKLDGLFAFLKRNGTEVIIEAEDMDKFCNTAVDAGSAKIAALAKKHGLDCRRLTWNPNYKGIDDWLLALRQKKTMEREKPVMTFEEKYLNGLCAFSDVDVYVQQWHEQEDISATLPAFLGLTDQEYAAYVRSGTKLQNILNAQRRPQRFRIYQLALDDGKTCPFAFGGIKALQKAGYEQPPAADYHLVYEGSIFVPRRQTVEYILARILERFQDRLPADYPGHSIAPSDVLELYGEGRRQYFYRDTAEFVPVKFSPALVKKCSKPSAIDGERLLKELNELSGDVMVPRFHINSPTNSIPHLADVVIRREHGQDISWTVSFGGEQHEDAYISFVNALNKKLAAQADEFQHMEVLPKQNGYPSYKVCRCCGGHRLYHLEFRTDHAAPQLYDPVNAESPQISQDDVPYRVSGTYCLDCDSFCETRTVLGRLNPGCGDADND